MSDENRMEQQDAPAAVPSSQDALIDRWFADVFHGSIAARDVDVFNHLHKAVEELKRRLGKVATTSQD